MAAIYTEVIAMVTDAERAPIVSAIETLEKVDTTLSILENKAKRERDAIPINLRFGEAHRKRDRAPRRAWESTASGTSMVRLDLVRVRASLEDLALHSEPKPAPVAQPTPAPSLDPEP